MKYNQKLKKIGDSDGIIIPKQLMGKLNETAGSPIFTTVSPRFYGIAKSLADKYKDAFENLARQ